VRKEGILQHRKRLLKKFKWCNWHRDGFDCYHCTFLGSLEYHHSKNVLGWADQWVQYEKSTFVMI
jgi:hypothetical protein